jgi:O-antigen ligase
MHKIQLNKFEKGLIIAILFTPFTLLRFGYIGLGEAGILLLFVMTLSSGFIKKLTKDHPFSRFWLIFLFISFLGMTYNTFVLDNRIADPESVLFDLAAYIFIAVTCLTVENLFHRQQLSLFSLLKYIYLLSGTIFTILFILSLYTDSLFGLPLTYFGHFSPLAANLHQVAMFIAPMPFIGLLLIERETGFKLRGLSFLFILLFSYLVIETGSFKALAGLLLGFGIYLASRFIRLFKTSYQKPLIVLLVVLFLLIVVINIQFFSDVLWGIFRAEDLQEGRSSLYSRGFDVAIISPFIGLGPGPHIYQDGQFWDSHQTLLTVFIQGGIIGFVLFLGLSYKIIRRIWKIGPLIAGFIPILTYIMGGDIMRRLPVWLLLMFFYYCSIQLEQVNSTGNLSETKPT